MTPDTLKVDGYYGPATASAIRTLQSTQMVEVTELPKPDDSCSFYWQSHIQSCIHPNLPKPVPTTPFKDPDYNDPKDFGSVKKQQLGLWLRLNPMVGLLASHRPKILFEAHQFSKLTDHQYDTRYPNI